MRGIPCGDISGVWHELRPFTRAEARGVKHGPGPDRSVRRWNRLICNTPATLQQVAALATVVGKILHK